MIDLDQPIRTFHINYFLIKKYKNHKDTHPNLTKFKDYTYNKKLKTLSIIKN